MTDDCIINVDNISFAYRNDFHDFHYPALNHISMQIKQGEFIAVIGNNGSGKSTLAKMFNALIVPDEGSITICGLNTNTRNEQVLFKIRQDCALVFQNPDNQLVTTPVEEDVAFALENLGVPPFEIQRRVAEALKFVGLTKYAKTMPHQLSGGQKQRVAIAGAIALHPKCLVLDEPTAFLDPSGREDVMRIIHELNRTGTTVILITHYMEEACRAKRIIILNNGEIIGDASPQDIFSNVNYLRNIDIAIPQTAQLLYELKKNNIRVDPGAVQIEQCVSEIYTAYVKAKKTNINTPQGR